MNTLSDITNDSTVIQNCSLKIYFNKYFLKITSSEVQLFHINCIYENCSDAITQGLLWCIMVSATVASQRSWVRIPVTAKSFYKESLDSVTGLRPKT